MLDWSKIDTVMLDMDGTLLDLHFDTYYWLQHLPERYSQLKGVTEQQAKNIIYPKLMSLRGQLDWYSIEHWATQFDIDIVALQHEVSHKIGFLSGTEDFLNWLSTSDKQIFLVTNADHHSLGVKQPHVRLDRWLHGFYHSHDYGFAKEEQGFWQALEKDIGYDPERSLMVDDNLEVLAAAQEAGIGHLLAVSKPDSQRPPQDTGKFLSVENVGQAVPTIKEAN